MVEEVTETGQATKKERQEVEQNIDTEAGFIDSITPGSAGDHSDEGEKPVENGAAKRGREEVEDGDGKGDPKKPKAEKSMDEEQFEKVDAIVPVVEDREGVEEVKEAKGEEGREEKDDPPVAVQLGPKIFCSSVEMFDYFYKLLHHWPPNLDINKYEHMVLLELLKKGHADASKKIGEGIQAFQVRYHPAWKSRCFFLVRVDGSVDDFSFRKCVDHILPLPENMKPLSASIGNNATSRQKGGGGRGGGGGRSRGRGGRGWRNREPGQPPPANKWRASQCPSENQEEDDSFLSIQKLWNKRFLFSM